MRLALAAAAMLFAALALAASPAEEAALRDIETFSTQQARIDPHYRRAEEEALKSVDAIVKERPPEEWAAAVRTAYLAASGRLHREERERARSSEAAIARGRPAAKNSELAGKLLDERFAQLAADLEAGRIGWREQAVRALEAASIYFPDDAALLRWRQAKIPIATAYEMGRLSLDELEARWQAATDAYRVAVAARAAALLPPPPSGSEIPAAVGNRLRRPPPITCNTKNVPGFGLQTTCR